MSATDAGSAASRMIVWSNCNDIVGLSDAALDQWQSRGVGGFVCKMDFLYTLGGSQRFTADPNSPLSGSAYDMQRTMRDSRIVSRAAARGIKMWLGVNLGAYRNSATPLVEWFNDTGWATQVIPNIRDLAGGAKTLGFAGIAFDEELYGSAAGPAGTWNWNYPGNTHPESAVRAEATARGAQFMQAIVAGFPNVDIVDIHPLLPEGWSELVQQEINHTPQAYQALLGINFWDGMTSVPGYGAVRFMDQTYSKAPQLYRATWDTAFTYDLNRMSAMFSRRLSNWSYASSRVSWSPFAWISSGGTSWEAARPPEYVATQLAAFRRWGMGGAFADYAYHGLGAFDYTAYVAAMQAAATPGIVDSQPPTVTVGGVTRNGTALSVSGSATDNMAVRAVRWRTASGATGIATMNWVVTGGNYGVGYQWRMDWTANIPAAPSEHVTITVEDVKGLLTSRSFDAP